jgi:hypothetical protein
VVERNCGDAYCGPGIFVGDAEYEGACVVVEDEFVSSTVMGGGYVEVREIEGVDPQQAVVGYAPPFCD